jgi:formylglycine-generating enzyme required for sulfatase activity
MSQGAGPRQTVFPPLWASRFGLDERSPYPFADLALGVDEVMRFRWIPRGRFLMGSPQEENGRDSDELLHEVELTRGFWLAETPCTQRQWRAVTGSDPSHFEGDHRPVESVSWEDCREFCRSLSRREDELSLRLPTEAEWEYACRAGTGSAFNDGSDCTQPSGKDPALDRLGWYDENSQETQDVAGKVSNRWGLFDMHGNVLEWCADWFGEYDSDQSQVDPIGPDSGDLRVCRGGGYWDFAGWCRSAYRSHVVPERRAPLLGFRPVAVSVGEPRKGGAQE